VRAIDGDGSCFEVVLPGRAPAPSVDAEPGRSW
jgi:hypothetical protein